MKIILNVQVYVNVKILNTLPFELCLFKNEIQNKFYSSSMNTSEIIKEYDRDYLIILFPEIFFLCYLTEVSLPVRKAYS